MRISGRRWSSGLDDPGGGGDERSAPWRGLSGAFWVSSKLVNYRIEQLEKKQDQVNNVIERTYKLEGQMVEVQHDIRDLKAERR